MNEKIEWWYVFVGVLVSIPLIVGFGLAIYFLAEDDDATRVGLITANILVLVSVTALAFWNLFYFGYLYKADMVATGNDGIGYITVTVKQQVIFSLWIAAVVDAFFAYYLCICQDYKMLYRKEKINRWIDENYDIMDKEKEEIEKKKKERRAEKKERIAK